MALPENWSPSSSERSESHCRRVGPAMPANLPQAESAGSPACLPSGLVELPQLGNILEGRSTQHGGLFPENAGQEPCVEHCQAQAGEIRADRQRIVLVPLMACCYMPGPGAAAARSVPPDETADMLSAVSPLSPVSPTFTWSFRCRTLLNRPPEPLLPC